MCTLVVPFCALGGGGVRVCLMVDVYKPVDTYTIHICTDVVYEIAFGVVTNTFLW